MIPSIGFDGAAAATTAGAAAGAPNRFGNDGSAGNAGSAGNDGNAGNAGRDFKNGNGNGTGTGIIFGFVNFFRMAAVFAILAILRALIALTPASLMAALVLAIFNGTATTPTAAAFATFTCAKKKKQKLVNQIDSI